MRKSFAMETITACIERLQNHFENFELRPTPSGAQLKEVQEYFNELPEEILAFYRHCNGFDCHITDVGSDGMGRMYGLDYVLEHLGYIKQAPDQDFHKSAFPLKDDGCGNMDFLWLGKDMALGCVAFWDHETEPKLEYLMGGTFTSYLRFLSGYLITCYHPNGDIKFEYDIDNPDIEEYPWPFDSDWIAAKDARAKAILEHTDYGLVFNEE